MPASALTLEQRVAVYASEVIHEPLNLKAMKILLETHFSRSFDQQGAGKSFALRGAVVETGIKEAVLAVVAASNGEVGRDVVLRKLAKDLLRKRSKEIC